MTHDELALSLAGHLRTDKSMTWCNIQLGPSGSVRPDVYVIMRSYANPRPLAYECKVSVSDFRADVTSGKWQAYLQYASGVYFACEDGLISKADVPAHCGLVMLKNGRWRAAKKAVLSPVTIPQDALLKLLIDGIEREGPRERNRRLYDSHIHDQRMRKRFGEVTGKIIRDVLWAEETIEHSKLTAKRIEDDARFRADQIRTEAMDLIAPLRIELCEILGLPTDCQQWTLANEVKRIKKELAEHPAHTNLKTLTRALQGALERHGYKEVEDDEESSTG